jgi:hypothetical protein
MLFYQVRRSVVIPYNMSGFLTENNCLCTLFNDYTEIQLSHYRIAADAEGVEFA